MSGFSLFPKGNKSADCSDFITLKKRQAIISSIGTNPNSFRQVENKSFTKDALNLGLFQAGLSIYNQEPTPSQTLVEIVNEIFADDTPIISGSPYANNVFNTMDDSLINKPRSNAIPIISQVLINHYSSIFATNSIPLPTQLYALSTVNISGDQVVDLNALDSIPNGSSVLIPENYRIQIGEYFFQTVVSSTGVPELKVTGPGVPVTGYYLQSGSTYTVPKISPSKELYFLGAASPGVVKVTTIPGPGVNLTVDDITGKNLEISVVGQPLYIGIQEFDPYVMEVNGTRCYYYGLIVPGRNAATLDGSIVLQTQGTPIYFTDPGALELYTPTLTELATGEYTFYLVAYDGITYYSSPAYYFSFSVSITLAVSLTKNIDPSGVIQLLGETVGFTPDLTSYDGGDSNYYLVVFPATRSDKLTYDEIQAIDPAAFSYRTRLFGDTFVHNASNYLPSSPRGSFTAYAVAATGSFYYVSDPVSYSVTNTPPINIAELLTPTPPWGTSPAPFNPISPLVDSRTLPLVAGSNDSDNFFISIEYDLRNQPYSFSVPITNTPIINHFLEGLDVISLPPLYALTSENKTINGSSYEVVSDYALETIPKGSGILIPVTNEIVMGDRIYQTVKNASGVYNVVIKDLDTGTTIETVGAGGTFFLTGTGLPNDLVMTNLGGASPSVVIAGTFLTSYYNGEFGNSSAWIGVCGNRDGPKFMIQTAGTPGSSAPIWRYDSTKLLYEEKQLIGANTDAWKSIACDIDGNKIIVCSPADILISFSDTFYQWVRPDIPGGTTGFSSATVSGDSKSYYATKSSGLIYKSSDSGRTWNSIINTNQQWTKIVCNFTGQVVVALCTTSSTTRNEVFVSTDYGSTFNNKSVTAGLWDNICMSSSDSIIISTSKTTGYVKFSSDLGNTWNNVTELGQQKWRYISVNFDASVIVGTTDKGDIFSSANYDYVSSINNKINAGEVETQATFQYAVVSYSGHAITGMPAVGSRISNKPFTFFIYSGFLFDSTGRQIQGMAGLGSGPRANPPKPTRFPKIPQRVTSIASNSFTNCPNLTGRLIVPAGVGYIGDDAFHGCTGLTGLVFMTSYTALGNNAFRNCSGFPLTTPKTTIKLFTNNSGWGSGGNQFTGTNIDFVSLPDTPQVATLSNQNGGTSPTDPHFYLVNSPVSASEVQSILSKQSIVNASNSLIYQNVTFGTESVQLRVTEQRNQVNPITVTALPNGTFPPILEYIPDLTKVYNFDMVLLINNYKEYQDPGSVQRGWGDFVNFFAPQTYRFGREGSVETRPIYSFYLPLNANPPTLTLSQDLKYTITNLNVQPETIGPAPNTTLMLAIFPTSEKSNILTNGNIDFAKLSTNSNSKVAYMVNSSAPVDFSKVFPELTYQNYIYSVVFGLRISGVYVFSNIVDRPQNTIINLVGTNWWITQNSIGIPFRTVYWISRSSGDIGYMQVFAVPTDDATRARWPNVFQETYSEPMYDTLIDACQGRTKVCMDINLVNGAIPTNFVSEYLKTLIAGGGGYWVVLAVFNDPNDKTNRINPLKISLSKGVLFNEAAVQPLPPRNLAYREPTSTAVRSSVRLSWDRPEGNVSGYIVYLNGSELGGLNSILSNGVRERNVLVDAMNPSTFSTLTVRSYYQTMSNISEPSNAVSLTTPDPPPLPPPPPVSTVPNPPISLNYADISDRSFTLSWRAPPVGQTPSGYYIFQNDIQIFPSFPTPTSASIINLTPLTQYVYVIKSYYQTSSNTSAPSDSFRFTTDPLRPPPPTPSTPTPPAPALKYPALVKVNGPISMVNIAEQPGPYGHTSYRYHVPWTTVSDVSTYYMFMFPRIMADDDMRIIIVGRLGTAGFYNPSGQALSGNGGQVPTGYSEADYTSSFIHIRSADASHSSMSTPWITPQNDPAISGDYINSSGQYVNGFVCRMLNNKVYNYYPGPVNGTPNSSYGYAVYVIGVAADGSYRVPTYYSGHRATFYTKS
jgi:photosystem II stability/assembly factor-like uncharacterized protein